MTGVERKRAEPYKLCVTRSNDRLHALARKTKQQHESELTTIYDVGCACVRAYVVRVREIVCMKISVTVAVDGW